jgi:hypothetical protein
MDIDTQRGLSLYSHRLPGKEQAENFSEDEFLNQECDGEGKHHPCHNCDRCDY